MTSAVRKSLWKTARTSVLLPEKAAGAKAAAAGAMGAAKLLPMPTVINKAAIKATFLVRFARTVLSLLSRSNICLVFCVLKSFLLLVDITKIVFKEGTLQYIVP